MIIAVEASTRWPTTLIVSLGIISKPGELIIIEIAVFLLVAQALVINRLAGLPYPVWRSKISSHVQNGNAEQLSDVVS